MRYELATLSVGVGTVPRVLAGIEAHAADPGTGGRLLGCWSSDVGALNQVLVLRGFADDAELLRERERTLRSSSPFGAAEHLVRLSLDAYAPFPGLPPVETGALGPVYEVRSYVLRPGGLPPTLEGWAERLPARTALSRLVVVMYALDGAPRITHVWPYRSLEERGAIRAEAVRQGIWPPRSSPWLTPEMWSTICLPASFSPLR